MDTKKLIKAIQLIIKEEVRKEVAKEKKALRKSLMNEIKKSQPKVVEKDPLDVDHIFETTHSTKQSFTGNSMLNDLLNETANDGEWRNMDSMYTSNQAQGFDRAQMASALGYGEQSVIPTVDVDGKPVDMAALQSSGVADALTRDYSGLMKAINAKKGK